MHELALCSAVADTVVQHAAGRPVRAVALRIGHFRQVVPDTLTWCWEMSTADGELAGCALDVEYVPAAVRCRSCDAETTLDAPILLCGACDGADVDLVSGEEFDIVAIDVATGVDA